MTDRVSIERLRELLTFDPATGVVVWAKVRPGRCKAGKRAGYVTKDRVRYRRIEIDGKMYGEHHVVWALAYGEWPSGIIDHINGDGTDNRIENLRAATLAGNAQNSKIRKNSGSGFKGVTWHKRHGKWYAQISKGGKKTFLGLHRTAEAAHAAYVKAAKEMFGEFARSS